MPMFACPNGRGQWIDPSRRRRRATTTRAARQTRMRQTRILYRNSFWAYCSRRGLSHGEIAALAGIAVSTVTDGIQAAYATYLDSAAAWIPPEPSAD
jgi:hypothetical protein